MTKNKKRKIILKKNIEGFSENDQLLFKYDNDKFIEIASSIAYYLKQFSSLKRFLEYISLVSNYLIDQEFSLLVPLDENGKIAVDNIFVNPQSNNNIEKEVKNFFIKSGLLYNFKLKIYQFLRFF